MVFLCVINGFYHRINPFLTADNLLEFIPIPGATTDENIYLTDENPDVRIDGMAKTSRSIYFLGTSSLTTHTVQFSCEVSRRATPLTDVKLCCGTEGKSATCHRVSKTSPTGSIACNSFNFGFSYNQYSGANFTLSFNPVTDHTFAYDGQVYCEVLDSEASIQSNEIDLRDAVFYSNQLGVVPGNTVEDYGSTEVSPLDFPLKFSCGNFDEKMKSWPSWMAAVWQQYLSPFEWATCTVDRETRPAGCAKSRQKISVGESVTTMDGTLFLLKPTLLSKNPNSAFVCVKRGTSAPIRVYAGAFDNMNPPKITQGLSLNPNAPSTKPDKFEALSPRTASYQFVDGTLVSDFYLRAFYRTPQDKSGIQAEWFKDGKKLTDNDATEYYFRLPERVSRSFAGTYELRVTKHGYSQLTFTFKITVVGPPKFHDVNCISDLFYAMEGTDKQMSCVLNSRGDGTIFKVGINGFEASSASSLKHILASSLQLQSQPISHLDINFWEFDSNGNKGVAVQVKGLKKDQNFRLSIKASNANGQSQVAGTVRVVRKFFS